MAVIIPELPPGTIENDGERAVYTALSKLPPGYTVLYSYKYRVTDTRATFPQEMEQDPVLEADFVVAHPCMGLLVIEVKQGNIHYSGRQWYVRKDWRTVVPLSKDPAEQARRAMYAIRDRYTEKARDSKFPLPMRFALCFPECLHITGDLPADLRPETIILASDLDIMEKKIRSMFPYNVVPKQYEYQFLMDKVLSPSFNIFSRLEDQIELFHRSSQKILTEEQQRILDETELDNRKVFFGAAGTGKTFLAMEKAKRLSSQGKKVLLTCYNKNLAKYFQSCLPKEICCSNFHDFLVSILTSHGYSLEIPSEDSQLNKFYEHELPAMGFDFFASADDHLKFDSIIVDEGQDFKEEWLLCLESMLRDGDNGEFYIFADPDQDIFGVNLQHLRRLPISRHRLMRNLRNTEAISNWLKPFIQSGSITPVIRGGMPVVYHPWQNSASERKMIEEEAERLVSQGIHPGRILILSPNRLEKSSLAGCDRIGDWKLEFSQTSNAHFNPRSSIIRFATIRSFKGLEADIVFLIGLKEGKQTCQDPDIYVGASRARFMLHVFYHKDLPPRRIAESI